MYEDMKNTRERSSSPPSRREAEAKHKHIDRMQHEVYHNIENNKAERQRRERT